VAAIPSINPGICITAAQEQWLIDQIETYRAQHAHSERSAGAHTMVMPMQPKSSFDGYGYFSITNFVDQNLTPNNNLLDYNCGARTYDWQTGNHQGTDYILWPYPWLRMDELVMEIVAAEGGTIIVKEDGHFDRNCLNNGNPDWNGIVIEHTDGSTAWYLHFKDGSITSKNIGETVAAGEYLGLAGSSGSSTLPHLHFEIRDALNNVIDPYAGPCNAMNTETWWADQEDYWEPAVNHVCSNTAPYVYDCPNPEITFERDTFFAGDTLLLTTFYRDLLNGAYTSFELFNPLNQLGSSWDFVSPWPDYSSAFVYWFYEVTAAWLGGTWRFVVSFEGGQYEHQFFIANPVGVNEAVDEDAIVLFPNPAGSEVAIRSALLNSSAEAVLTVYNVSTGQFAGGIYFVKLQTAGGQVMGRLVVED
jgi:hypothetical protein